MASESAKRWNNSWWGETKHSKKHALPTIHNVRAKKAKAVKRKKPAG